MTRLVPSESLNSLSSWIKTFSHRVLILKIKMCHKEEIFWSDVNYFLSCIVFFVLALLCVLTSEVMVDHQCEKDITANYESSGGPFWCVITCVITYIITFVIAYVIAYVITNVIAIVMDNTFHYIRNYVNFVISYAITHVITYTITNVRNYVRKRPSRAFVANRPAHYIEYLCSKKGLLFSKEFCNDLACMIMFHNFNHFTV